MRPKRWRQWVNQMIFHNPEVLILLPFIIVCIIYAKKKRRHAGFRFSSSVLIKGLKPSFRLRSEKGLIFLRMTGLCLIVIALARPQSSISETKITTEGIDIILAIDTSTSMLAEDFTLRGKRQNRLKVVKSVVKEFVKGRPDDRIALIAFAARGYMVSPLTLDHGWLLQNLERVKIGMIEDGTAIGSGIMSSLNRIKDTDSKGKVIILLTDGRNNAGKISPLTAAEAAKALKVKVYTIGAGTKGLAPYPVKDFFGNTVYKSVKIDIDEDILNKIAQKTGAKYFRATDTKSLIKIYKEIDRLEKRPIEETGYLKYNELFPYFLTPAIVLIFLEVALGNTIFRRLP
ncbi:MAG: VWA domain-containing protein [Nitrospirota bacterium]